MSRRDEEPQAGHSGETERQAEARTMMESAPLSVEHIETCLDAGFDWGEVLDAAMDVHEWSPGLIKVFREAGWHPIRGKRRVISGLGTQFVDVQDAEHLVALLGGRQSKAECGAEEIDSPGARPRRSPVETLRDGALTVSVWRNENGPPVTVTAARRYQDREGSWKSAQSLTPREGFRMVALLEEACERATLLGEGEPGLDAQVVPQADCKRACSS